MTEQIDETLLSSKFATIGLCDKDMSQSTIKLRDGTSVSNFKLIRSSSTSHLYSAQLSSKKNVFVKQRTSSDDKKEAVLKHLLELPEHPNIVHLIDAIYFPDPLGISRHFGFVMELADGGDLSQVIRSGECYYSTGQRWIRQISGGLAFLHERQKIHGNLKPTNVLIFGENKQHLKLTDFGELKRLKNIAIPLWDDSYCYMAPEVLRYTEEKGVVPAYSYSADIYSLSVIWWEILHKQSPFKFRSVMKFYSKLTKGMRPIFDEDIDESLKRTIERCWDSPEARPSAMEVHAFAERSLELKTSQRSKQELGEVKETVASEDDMPQMPSFGSDLMMDQSSGHRAERREKLDVLAQNFAGISELEPINNVNLPPSESDLEPLNSIVPKYALDSFIRYPEPILGIGSFGTALKVFSTTVGTAVVKINIQPQAGIRRESSDVIKKRRREFVNCFLLISHPNIVTLYGYIYETDEKHPIGILMEYMAGGTVLDYVNNYLKAPQQFPLPEIMQNTWAKQIAMGLKFMHERRIAHRDIKPNNILLAADYRTAKIADFGLAKNLAESPSKKHSHGIGFWQYTAPEMIMEKIYNYQVDCYSFGMVLYFIYYHRLPFENDAKRADMALYRALKGEGQPPLRPQLRTPRAPIDELMERCWPVDPQERLTMHEIVDYFYNREGLLNFPTYDI